MHCYEVRGVIGYDFNFGSKLHTYRLVTQARHSCYGDDHDAKQIPRKA